MLAAVESRFLAESRFLLAMGVELFKAFKAEGFHTCMDTSLYAPTAAIDALLPYVDMWLAL